MFSDDFEAGDHLWEDLAVDRSDVLDEFELADALGGIGALEFVEEDGVLLEDVGVVLDELLGHRDAVVGVLDGCDGCGVDPSEIEELVVEFYVGSGQGVDFLEGAFVGLLFWGQDGGEFFGGLGLLA